ncbi:hypothetical protein Gorai_016401 [Gossypium raimondii]|uniref:Uncharacterized protein n=1 Tax=Gossypium raimondii TaxID=29730 RepID=A0A7J8P8X7_GOSRA|nr:hypothetical protein [Gossypium raimondii]
MAKPSPATGGRRGGSPDQWSNSKIALEKSLWDLILTHLNTKKRVDVFTLSIYGLVIFPKALGHIDKTISYLLDRLDKRVTPVPKVEKVSYRVFSESYSPRKEFVATLRRDNIFQEKWMAILQSLQVEDVE